MCRGSALNLINGKCICEALVEGKIMNKKQLLARLKEHKEKLESELEKVDKEARNQRLSPRKEVIDDGRHDREEGNREN
jgi:hypothetical protein